MGKNLFSVFRLFAWDVFRAEGCLQAFGSTAFVFRKIFGTGSMLSQHMNYADQSVRWGEINLCKFGIHLWNHYDFEQV